MEIGLLHLHRTLAYAIFLIALVNLVIALSKGRTDAGMAGVLHWTHKGGVMMAGRLTLVVGIVLFAVLGTYPLTSLWMWSGILLWAPIEIVSKRFVQPEIDLVKDGGSGSSRLVIGTAIELVCIVLIFGLMTARPF